MENRSMFVGLDVHKETIDVSIAEGQRDGEVRHYGVIASDVEPLDDEAEDTTAVRLVVQRPGSPRIATALRARQRPSAASSGALRAALTRAHAVASMQLCDAFVAGRITRRECRERPTRY